MKRTAAFLLLSVFMLQVGVKSLVMIYYQTFQQEEAKENCIYKEMTICKGSCYITKQIRIITSSPENEKKDSHPFQVSLNMFKDLVCISTGHELAETPSTEGIPVQFFYKVSLYDFSLSTTPFRPPIG